MTAVQIQARDIKWQVDDKVIVDQVSFCVNQNETLGIVGPNGAGKTSLLKCLYQEHQLSSGQITLDGRALSAYDRKAVAKKIAVVGQQHEAVFNLSVLDIVTMGLIPHKALFDRNNDQDRRAIEEALAIVDLLDKQHQVFNTLSGGEQQRCLIARAIVQRPQILIMDEPTNHLDVFYQHQILSLVKKLGLTLIMTIHDLNLAAQYCDRLLLLSAGKMLVCDTPEAVLKAEMLKQVFHLECLVDQNPLTNKMRVTYAMHNEAHIND
ncbi:ABC transporter ATP-binding protein [Thalassotalea sp. G2M2-11]|uniref:ABC transporter ATP-binding protein n=1 Tax=Thalassotalea sp. G2M2-11 TaxID=2787627 RepID=UPI0019D1E5C2|nr:ABC transporter ATP-binding protein [Thalassotalea sp. G2M2-11]